MIAAKAVNYTLGVDDFESWVMRTEMLCSVFFQH
jgi:hypothetical protein